MIAGAKELNAMFTKEVFFSKGCDIIYKSLLLSNSPSITVLDTSLSQCPHLRTGYIFFVLLNKC